jgi:hypothetical protein
MLSAQSFLRPLGLGELLDRAFRLYRRYFVLFIAIYAIVEIPLTVLEWLATHFTPARFGQTASWVTLVSLLLNVFVRTVYTAAITRTVANSYLGQPIGFLSAYRGIGPYWARLIQVSFYSGLVNLALGLWTLVPCVGWLTGPGMIFYFASVVVPLAAPVLVIEGRGAQQTVRRVWELVRRRFWWVFGFVLLSSLIQLAAFGPSFLAGVALEIFWPSTLNDPQAQVLLRSALQTLFETVNTLLYQPFASVLLVLLYFDLRARLEGLDLAVLAGSLTGQAAAEVVARAPDLTQAKLFTQRELAYFVFVGLVYAGLIALIIIVAPGLALFNG